MFFNKKVMNGVTLKHAWRACHNQHIDSNEVNLPKLCMKLDLWIENDYADARRRLSLRTSSAFINGAAKLYKQSLDDLLDDAYKLDMNIIKRRRTWSTRQSEDGSGSGVSTICSDGDPTNDVSCNESGDDCDYVSLDSTTNS